MSEKVPIVVVIGVDTEGKSHASRFTDGDMTLVARAAELMGFHIVRVPTEQAELHGVAERLPVGKIFASGRAFVPFVARLTFDKLAALVDGGVTSRERSEAGESPAYPQAAMFTADTLNTADALWAKIEVGSIVLAAQPDTYGPGWWESVVVSVNGDALTLRWLDGEGEPEFQASRRDVGLRHPDID